MPEETTIHVESVNKSFGPHKAVQDVSFNVQKGEIVGFLGPNGAGKSTTMRLLTSYYTPDSGDILINGINNAEHDLETRRSYRIACTPRPLPRGIMPTPTTPSPF